MKFLKPLGVIIIVAMLVGAAFLTIAPSAQAFDSQWDTFFYVIATPNPVGVGQTVVVTMGIDKVHPFASMRANNFEGFICKITRPDGTTETKGPMTTYSMANTYFMYTPTQAGNYTFEGSWPGQWANGSYTSISASYGNWANGTGTRIFENRWYKPSHATTTLTVQSTALPTIPDTPLPTDAWTRPISGENKGWYHIADNWLMLSYDQTSRTFSATAFAPYTSAPNSPHILWKQPVTFGGIIGGPYGDKTYYTGLSYEQFYLPMIIQGRIIYADHGPTTSSAASIFGTRCISLYTGEEIWYLNNTNIAFAQVLEYDSGNEHGGLSYLWSTSGSGTNQTWYMYDAFAGRQILTVTNVTAGTTIFGPSGELLSYSITGTGANRRMIMWNSSLAIVGFVNDYWSPAFGSIINGARGIQWNASMPALPGDPTLSLIAEDTIFLTTVDMTQYPPVFIDVAFPATLNPDSSGNYPTSTNPLWNLNRTNIQTHRPSLSRNIGNGIYARWDQALTQIHGYSIRTGQELWVTNPLPMGWGLFSGGLHIAYGKIYMGSYDGHLRAYDTTNGKLAWDYYTGSAGFENAYGTFPAYGFTIADHTVFLTNDEHSPDAIPWRNGNLTAINADTGAREWMVDGRHRHTTISDGILTTFNLYDNQIYTFGKGPSKTTVVAPQTAIITGLSIIIQGTVTDQTPSSKDTPAISDQNMGAWMAYLHMQKTKPTDATGVPIKLAAIDSNGNTVDLGTVYSDMSGLYSQVWTPTQQGKYIIVATFEGSNSYSSSSAETAVIITQAAPAPTTTVAPTPVTPTATVAPTATISASPTVAPTPGTGLSTETLLIAGAAIVIIIAVIAAALVLRKRK
jgi:hypothetical protein